MQERMKRGKRNETDMLGTIPIKLFSIYEEKNLKYKILKMNIRVVDGGCMILTVLLCV